MVKAVGGAILGRKVKEARRNVQKLFTELYTTLQKHLVGASAAGEALFGVVVLFITLRQAEHIRGQ